MNNGNLKRVKFMKYDAAHPQTWELFVRFTTDAINAGCKNLSMRMLFRRMHWETITNKSFYDELKISKNYNPYYAQKFHRMFPQHDGLFRARFIPGDELDAVA